ncbi:MAG: hypothetical protein KKH68_14215, partial [Proteobacteria bacterium]|nr:hypothetical protein [Pseudomonadota bacterium]
MKFFKITPNRRFGMLMLLIFFLFNLDCFSAFAVDFVTQEQFATEKSIYKDYPFKILFKKLIDSDAAEKQKIQNTIILKQVFDRNMQEKVRTGIVQYNRTFGIIEAIDKDHLKVWLPGTDKHIDFYLGIDRIPLINENNYAITDTTIGKFASIVYTLDNRIYKIQVSFQPAAPTGLSVKRENGKNIVGWIEPSMVPKPSAYKVYINEKPFGEVTETAVNVPVTKDQVDKYYVKAVYQHGDGFIDSDASEVRIDAIAAKEKQQAELAAATYSQVIVALNPAQWQQAQKTLYDNRQLFAEHLDDPRKQNTNLLIAFFGEIDQGDRLGALTPLTAGSLESAIEFYRRAEQKAATLPPNIDVSFIPPVKIEQSRSRIAQLKTLKQAELAAATYSQVIAALNPAQWQQAQKILYDNRQLFAEHLDDPRKQNTNLLIAFFGEIDQGDRLSALTPLTAGSLESAIEFYRRAEQKAATMPPAIDVTFIPPVKIEQSRSRIAQLKTLKQEDLAAATYSQVIAALNPAQWQQAQKTLYDNRQLFAE